MEKKINVIVRRIVVALLITLNVFKISCSEESRTRNLYLELIKKILINSIYEDNSYHGQYNQQARDEGKDWPFIAHTMIGLKRLNNLQYCIETILKENVEGDLVETGVWGGGATILMRAVLKAYDIKDRIVWAADSFEGLPLFNNLEIIAVYKFIVSPRGVG